MYDDPHIEDKLRGATPKSQPPADIDVDAIIREGTRLRRRNRLVLGGTSAVAVAVLASVVAVATMFSPAGGDEEAPVAQDQSEQPTEEPIEDPSMAGYPYDSDWASEVDEDTGYNVRTEEAVEVHDALTEAFGQLLADSGMWDDPLNTDEGACQMPDDFDPENPPTQDPDECEPAQIGLAVEGDQRPGNYGQVWLRSYRGGVAEEVGGIMGHLRDAFSVEVMLPGGWTDEPGPITEQLFPQHLISDGPYYTDQAPEFTTEDLDDGRTLMVADHGCARDLALTYPNGTAMRVTWDVDCEGTTYPVDYDELVDAMLSVPEFDLDTSELTAVSELEDVPVGWVYDRDAWADSADANAQARETYSEARDALQELYPEATLSEGGAVSLGQMDRGANLQRSYSANGTLPFETTVDETVEDTYFSMRYYLPGGWVPGFSETGGWDTHLTVCKDDFQCESWTDEDGTFWAFEELEVTHEPMEGEDWDPITEHEIYATMYSPDGWAVGMWVSWQNDTPIDRATLEEILRAMPAPEYDADAVPEIPAG